MSDFVIVTVIQGDLKGKKVTGNNGVTYYSFQGIPYAEPPIGPLRFKAPQEPNSWTGIREALSLGSVCPQYDIFHKNLTGDEDCLFLNVYTPQILPSILLPVMVWIHGGGFLSGSGNTDIYGPEYLIQHDVILVTLNYRLGPLGFLDVPGTDSTANNGLKDQVLALKWVQKNIMNFGGDPKNVTIFGQSAGGLSVHCHMLSPLSTGMFHKAIIMSAPIFGSLSSLDYDVEKVFRLAEKLGYSERSPQEAVDFLRKVSTSDLSLAYFSGLSSKENYMGIVIEDPGAEALIYEKPKLLLRSGRYNDVPVIAGVTSAEGKLCYSFTPTNDIDFTRYSEDVESLISHTLRIEENSKSEEINDKIRNFYFGNQKISEATRDDYIDLYGDLTISYGMHKMIEEHAARSISPLYYYRFSYDGRYNFLSLIGKDTPGKGAGHGDELFYLFRSDDLSNIYVPGTPEHKISYTMTKLWTNFAKTGSPNCDCDMNWPPVTKHEKWYLDIDIDLEIGLDLNKERMEFWEEIYYQTAGDTVV